MPAPDPNRLNDLKRRWAQDPGSRLYLQLADELRKQGQLEEAETVLVKGLEHRPSDLSGLVALGRCRLELGVLDEAVASLETVIARDPAHMVANKLLVEAHLQRGDGERAEERLKTYRLLNDRDPELDQLAFRLQQLAGGSSPAEEAPFSAPPPADEPVSKEAVLEGEESEKAEAMEAEVVGADIVVPEVVESEAMEQELAVPVAEPVTRAAIPLAAPSNGDQIFYLGPIPAPPSLEALWQEPPPAPRLAEPFSGLSARSVADALAWGDVFCIEPGPVEVPARAADRLLDTRRTELPPSAAGEAAAEPSAPLTLIAEPAPVVEEAPTERLEIAELPFEPTDRTPTEKVEIRLPAAEPPAAAAEVDASALAAEGEEEEAATVTLGGLYLKQGYLEEAARIFAQVLEHDPKNQAAQAGLNLARRPQPTPLTALELVADHSLPGTMPMGLTAKKLLVLTNYLKHIRSRRERDHVH